MRNANSDTMREECWNNTVFHHGQKAQGELRAGSRDVSDTIRTTFYSFSSTLTRFAYCVHCISLAKIGYLVSTAQILSCPGEDDTSHNRKPEQTVHNKSTLSSQGFQCGCDSHALIP